jgi:hypothetical protein
MDGHHIITTASGANINLALNQDLKFTGTGSKITAEQWHKMVSDRVEVNKYNDEDAIAFARSLLDGPAAVAMEELAGCSRAEKRGIRSIFAAFLAHYRSLYYAHTTQAETITDWSSMRQVGEETIQEFANRVTKMFRMFVESTSGKQPPDLPPKKDKEPPNSFKLEKERADDLDDAIAKATRETNLLPRKNDELNTIKDHFLNAQKVAMRAATVPAEGPGVTADMVTAAKAQRAMDLELLYDAVVKATPPPDVDMAVETARVTARWTEAIQLNMAYTYEQLVTNLSRALLLKTIHTGAKHAKTREEAFVAIKEPSKPLTVVLQSMKLTEFELDSKVKSAQAVSSAMVRPTGVNAIASGEGGNADLVPEDSSTQEAKDPWQVMQTSIAALTDNINALANAHRKSEKNKKDTSKTNSKKPGDIRKCYNCDKIGHISADCKQPRRPRKKEQSGN